MRRSVTRTGPSSLTVTLPADWAKAHDLEPGDEVNVDEDQDTLHITTVDQKDEEITVTYRDTLFEHILRDVFEQGYDQVNVTGFPSKQRVRETVDTFPGLIITDESDRIITIHRTLDTTWKNSDAILRRAFLLLKEGLQENPPTFNDDVTDLLFRLQATGYEERLVNQLENLHEVINVNKPFYDSLHAEIRDIFTSCYEQFYDYEDARSKAIVKRLDDKDDVQRRAFARSDHPSLVSKGYLALHVLEEIHDYILEDASATRVDRATTTKTGKHVGVCLADRSNEFWNTAVRNAIKSEEDTLSFDIRAPSFESDVDRQREILNDFLDDGVDAIIYFPVDNQANQATLKRVNETETPLIVIDTPLDLDGVEHSFIGFDNHHGGALVGDYLDERLADKSNVLVIAGRHHGNSKPRVQGFKDALSETHDVTRVKADYAKSIAYEKTREELRSDEYDAIFAVSDNMAVGALNAAEDSDQDVLVCGFDYTEEGRQALEDGRFLCDVDSKPGRLASYAARQAKNAIRDSDTPESIEYDIELKTAKS